MIQWLAFVSFVFFFLKLAVITEAGPVTSGLMYTALHPWPK